MRYQRGTTIIMLQKLWSWSCNVMTDNNCVVWTHKNVQNSSSCPLCVNHFMFKHKDDNFYNESWFVTNERNKYYRVNFIEKVFLGFWTVLQCQTVLGAGGTQEYGCLVLCPAQDSDSYWWISQVDTLILIYYSLRNIR